ncbi:MAG: hypothetical protein HY364_04265 [Candidatus Aenigmarchaeota archaeon]|nr:hypothetical protein [Candidatus Aenigmarchaeota archaeon]
MTYLFHINSNGRFLPDKIPEILTKLFALCRDKSFFPISFRFWNKEDIDIKDLNFEKLRPYITERKKRGAQIYEFEINNGRMQINYYTKFGYPGDYGEFHISLDNCNYLLDENGSWDEKHLERRLEETINYCVAIIKSADSDFVIGGWEEYESSVEAWQIDFLVIKKALWKNFLREHIKYKFRIDLSEDIIEKLTKETAYSVEERGDLMIINFSAFRKEGRFYRMVEKLAEARKK